MNTTMIKLDQISFRLPGKLKDLADDLIDRYDTTGALSSNDIKYAEGLIDRFCRRLNSQ